MRLLLTPLFFIAIAAAAGFYAGPAAGVDELRQAAPGQAVLNEDSPAIAAR